MQIRKLTRDDLPRASALCLDAFMLTVAPSLSALGVQTFANAALEPARGDAVTVRASLSSVAAYESYGFALAGDVGESAGQVYQPMARRCCNYLA